MACILSLMLVLSGCGGDSGGESTTGAAVGTGDGTATGVTNDDGIDTGIAATATTVAGKVTLSSIVTAKARKKAAISHALKRGKPGSKAYQKALAKATADFKALDSRALPSRASFAAFSNGIVELYNSSHPEWIYPIAQTTTDADGIYTLETLINADKNDNAYTDGGQIPGGNYTLLAYTIHPKTKRPYLVALQAVVSEFAGVISGIDLVAQTSTAEPTITSMLGVTKNKDGTQTWGDADLDLAPNAAVQIAFSMAMNRAALTDLELDFAAANGSTIPTGVWTLSADWLTATYYLNNGQSWPAGDTYTITVYGADTTVEKTVDGFPFTGEDLATFNVFGKSLKLTGVGTFSIPAGAIVDTQAPTAQLSSPTLAQTANPVEVVTPIRVASNERMDVNGLRLKSVPSLGAQPGVLFVGKNDDSLYEYEFLLGEPLKLGTTYTMTVSGGKDLAGNEMNALTASFTTEATSEGVVDTTGLEGAELETALVLASNQADVKDVFGKWVRAFSDRNLPQLQSVMAGDFFMEYNAASGFAADDVNRDGLYDLKEFSEMMASAFTLWDFCGVTLTGKVNESINIVGGEIADFGFTLEADTDNKSQDCQSAAPDQELFATLQKVNGAWYIVRASEGIDTRGQEITEAVVLNITAPEDASVLKFYDEALDEEVDVSFTWDEAVIADQDVASYAFILIDSRNPQSGFAMILPPTMTSLEIPSDIDTLMDAGTIADVSENFGFTDPFDPRDGAELYWQVAALGSNTVNDILNDRATSLPKDVVSISELWRFKIAGEYQELTVAVEADGTSVKFSEFIYGYDVAAAAEATITITTPRTDATAGYMFVDGNTHEEYPFTFTNGVGSVTVDLNKGINNIQVMDGQPCWVNGGNCDGEGKGDRFVEEHFQIVTTGGIPAVIALDTVKSVDADGVETTLVNDGWDWYESSDAVSLMITGSVDESLIGQPLDEVRLDVWNDKAHARATRKISVDASGNFSAEVEIFKGENWVGIHGHICESNGGEGGESSDDGNNGGPGNCQDFNANFGINTDAGSEYTPPIRDIVMSDASDATVVVAQNENWGDGGRWDASAVTGNQVTISGVLEFATDNSGDREPRYDVGSDGGWNSDRISVGLDGSFSFTIDLFAGNNFVNIQDVNDNWFHLDIYTSAGKAVVRPEIVTIDGTAFDGGDFNTTQCSATLAGTAMEGEMRVMWNANAEGNGEFQNFWEEIKTEADADGNWTATVPLIGSADDTVRTDNFVDVFDKNWNWMGVHFINTGDCDYTPPQMNVTGVKDDDGNDLALLNGDSYPDGGGWAEFGNETTSAKAPSQAGTEDMSAIPLGSTVVMITNPVKDQMDVGTVTLTGMIDLTQFALTGDMVARLMVKDPTMQEGPPSVLMSNRSDDPVQADIANFPGVTGGTFTVDSSTGDVSADLALDAGKPYEVILMVWNDMNLGMDANPEHGYFIQINGAMAPEDGGGFGPGPGDDSVKTDSIVIEGTSNVADKSINFEVFGCGGVERYSATAGSTADADGNYAWTSPAITVYQGHNNIGVSNGPQWFNINLNASNNVPLPDPVLTVDVTGATKDTFGREECGNSNWNAGSASTVIITGTSTTGDGQGEYHADGDFGRFDIVDGAFSFEVTLYNGNNHIGVNDANWNHHSVNIQTTGGAARPQFVALDTTTFAAGTHDVTGTIYADPADDGADFMPEFVGGGMNSCDSSGNCMWMEFSSDPNAADWGALPIALTGPDATTGDYTFSFSAEFDGNSSYLNIWVDGMNADGGWAGHGIETPINDTSCSDCTRYWKASATAAQDVGTSRQADVKAKAARSKGNH